MAEYFGLDIDKIKKQLERYNAPFAVSAYREDANNYVSDSRLILHLPRLLTDIIADEGAHHFFGPKRYWNVPSFFFKDVVAALGDHAARRDIRLHFNAVNGADPWGHVSVNYHQLSYFAKAKNSAERMRTLQGTYRIHDGKLVERTLVLIPNYVSMDQALFKKEVRKA